MIYELKNDKIKVQIDSLGATLISLKDSKNIEYIWQRNVEHWGDCAPNLFPIVGRLEDGYTLINGKKYEIPIHGFAKNTDFSVMENSKEKLVFMICSNEETKKLYPFEFEFYITYVLDDASLKCKYFVVNKDNEEMYFCLGGHPGFNCPIFEGEKFEDYELVFENDTEFNSCLIVDPFTITINEKKKIPSDGNKISLSYDYFNPDAIVFDDLKSNYVKLIGKKSQKGVKVDYKGFKTIAFWTLYDKKSPFLCIEPWIGSGCRKGENHEFTNKKDIIKLNSKESYNAEFIISVI